jgi:2-polyprenyl-3-methyl-5-hydroxy-6-metoxy-1,4-benzoquinol methylase
LSPEKNKPDNSIAAAGVFDKYAREYSERFGDTSAYHESFGKFCEAVRVKEAEILELACGPGNITRYMKMKRPDFNILATDLSPNMLKVARELNPGVEFRIMDCREIIKLGKKFDGIIMGFCLPYLSAEETRKLILDATIMLHRGGVIYISTMEDDYAKSGIQKGSKGDEIFMHYYPGDFLTTLLEENGFKVTFMERKITNDSSGNPETDLLIVAVNEK